MQAFQLDPTFFFASNSRQQSSAARWTKAGIQGGDPPCEPYSDLHGKKLGRLHLPALWAKRIFSRISCPMIQPL